eukprot:287264_1
MRMKPKQYDAQKVKNALFYVMQIMRVAPLISIVLRENVPCNIQCTGIRSCAMATFIGNASSYFTLICPAERSCMNAVRFCPSPTQCSSVSCCCSGYGQCSGMTTSYAVTTEPTLIPTDYPIYVPTNNPTVYPTFTPSSPSTNNPTNG